jgi:hypothetical protein
LTTECGFERRTTWTNRSSYQNVVANLRISSPGEDHWGRPIKEKKVIEVTSAVVNGLYEAKRAIEKDSTRFHPNEATVQLHAEAVPGHLSLIYEVLPFGRGQQSTERYVIATPDEKIRFIVGLPEAMGELCFQLESSIK